MGRLTQIVYPSLGVTFISIQENVNTATKTGLEMMPFYNIFNEWYAEQTSKKIRAVWKSKAEHGKRISPTVPYGYKKSPNDREQWLIDEPAAEVVRKIFNLCLAGRGPSQIARDLEAAKILTPTAYFNSNVARQSEVQKLKQSLATSERRIKMIDKAIEELFEANISGKVSDERFVKMTDNYEKEQKELLELVADGNKKLQDAEQNKVDLKLLMKALRDYTDIRQLTPEIVNALIRRIEVHSKDKKTKKVKVDIYLTAVGLFTPPTEQELQMAMEEIRRNPQQFGISA